MVQSVAGPVDRCRSDGNLTLRATRYEKVSAALTSVLLLVGAITFLMLLVWLTRTTQWTRPPARILQGGGGVAETPNALPELPIPDFQPPGQEELAEASEPPPEPALETLAAIVESQRVTIDALTIGDGESRKMSGNRGRGGDGPPGDGPIIGNLPVGDRWEVRFSTGDLDEYKRQLDFLGIEFGIAGGGIPTVDYVKGFAASSPAVRLAQDPKQEKRLRFLYRDGPLKEVDRGLARAAGINVEGRIIFHFYTDEMYQLLTQLENDRMKPHSIDEVVRTIFGIKKAGNGYQIFVIRQDYRHPAALPTRQMPRIL